MRWTWWQNREQDLERELRSDLELEAAEQQENGLTAEEARYAARRALGNTTVVAEEVREMWGWTWIGSCVQDLSFGSRILLKSPGISLAVVLSLALGLGPTTALFSLLNALLFKALPVAEPERLVVLRHGEGTALNDVFSYPQYAMLREAAKDAVDLFAAGSDSNRLQSGDVDRKIETLFVSGDFHRILGIQPLLGRLLEPADDVRGSVSATAAVISYRLWQRAFHGDMSVVGRKILIDTVPFTIAGVTPSTFFGVEVGGDADITLPLASKPALSPQFKMLECRGCYWLSVMGRLKPGFGASKAEAGLNVIWKDVQLATISESMPERYKARYFQERVALAPGATGLSELREGRFTKPLFVLLAMTGVILLICCSNVANLLMARALARQREFAVRLSIGAGRGRLVRQLLTESALLAAAALAASLALYPLCVSGLVGFLRSGGQQVYLDTSPDPRMVAFVTGSSVLTLALFGLAPALRATGCRLSGALAESSRSVAGRSSLGRLILCAQLALSFSLLVAAILLSRSLYDLRTFNAGFRREHLLLISPDTSREILKYSDQLRYTEAILSGIRDLAGTRSASASVVLPMSDSSWQRDFTAPGYVPRRESDYHCYENLVTPDFFRTMGTRLLLGRVFTERDDETGPKVVVVNESLARHYWGNDNPVGKQFHEVDKHEGDKKELLTVVGVVEDAKYRDFRKAVPPTVYLPLRQVSSAMGWSLHLEVWTYGEPHSLIPPARDLLNRQLKGVPTTFQTFTELIDERLLYERLLTVLSVSFGVLGILICAVGIYGLAAYSVNRRTAEIGIRMALGATPGAVMRLILREQTILVCAGLGAGAVGALIVTRFLRTWLFGVSPTDVGSLAAGMLCLAGITALATSIPARRAAGIEPLRALRHE